MENQIIQVETNLPSIKAPEAEVAFATACANALMNVIESKKKKVIINGQQYLEFEDWQTIARFYRCTVIVEWTKPLTAEAKFIGYEARAKVVNAEGREISAAEANCSITEVKWKNRDRFQLKSMAQTRACAKALRNVFSWVVVLKGLGTTPAEEMAEYEDFSKQHTNIVANNLSPVSGDGNHNSSASSSQPTQNGRASEKQVNYIKSLMEKKSVMEVDALGLVGSQASNIEDLTSVEASHLIEALNKAV